MSPSFPIIVSVAEIPIRILLPDKHSFLIIANRYADYITNNRKFIYTVAADSSRKNPYKRHGVYHINSASVLTNLAAFNDYFRLVMSDILNRNQGVILHASSLVLDNKGYVFMGQEGAGKSTIRLLHPTLTSLGDDSAILKFSNKKLYLYGSPFYQRTKMAYPNKKVVIRGIYSLRQSVGLMVSLAGFPINYELIMARSFISELGARKKELALLSKTCYLVADKNMIFNLHFPKTYQFVPLLKRLSPKKANFVKPAKTINPNVAKLIPPDMVWNHAVVDIPFLGSCRVLKETSWQFEFGGERKIEKIAVQIKNKQLSGPHTALILKKAKTAVKSIFIAHQSPNRFTLLDGNHKAIAICLRNDKNRTFPVIIGEAASLGKKFASLL